MIKKFPITSSILRNKKLHINLRKDQSNTDVYFSYDTELKDFIDKFNIKHKNKVTLLDFSNYTT